MLALRHLPLVAAAAIFFFLAPPHAAAGDPRGTCIAGKTKAAGKSVACRTAAMATIDKGGKADVAACDKNLVRAFSQVERTAGPHVCPTEEDAAVMQRMTEAQAETLHARLGGERFVDQGDGTIIDRRLGLQWEKKIEGSGCLHCVADRYAWTAGVSAPDGAAFGAFLPALNACESADGGVVIGGFAGHCDWRLPTYDELRSIFDFDACFIEGRACVPAVFGPTAPSIYWTVISRRQYDALMVDFSLGFDGWDSKQQPHAVRAVRTMTTQ